MLVRRLFYANRLLMLYVPFTGIVYSRHSDVLDFLRFTILIVHRVPFSNDRFVAKLDIARDNLCISPCAWNLPIGVLGLSLFMGLVL